MAQTLAEREAENLFVHTRDDINNELINSLPLERVVHLKNCRYGSITARVQPGLAGFRITHYDPRNTAYVANLLFRQK